MCLEWSCDLLCWWQTQLVARANGSRMLTDHVLPYLHRTSQFAKLFQTHAPMWEQFPKHFHTQRQAGAGSARASQVGEQDSVQFPTRGPGLHSTSPNSGRILWDKIYAFMQRALPSCDANLSRENLVPCVWCEPSQVTLSLGCFLFRLNARRGGSHSK